jgi:phospholipase/carboxylesterase
MSTDNVQTDLSIRAEINLYYDLYIPENAEGSAPLLIAVHGYGAHKRYMMREARLVAPKNYVIASLQGPHQHFRRTDDGYRTGFGWLTDHDPEESIHLHHKFVIDVIHKLADEKKVDSSRVYMYGFSQSCALNFRFALTYPDVLSGIVGLCGGIPSDLETNPMYKPFAAQTLYLFGNDDEFYPTEKFKEFDAKLRALLPSYRSKQYLAKHEITDEMRHDVREFLKAV